MVNLLGLNVEQHDAVTLTQGAVLILSGAGTGKTKTLVTRIAYILENKLAQPWEILAVTFTNAAAKEMKNRLFEMVGEKSHGVWLMTFHRMAVRILRKYAENLGFDDNFVIVDGVDQKKILKKILTDLNLKYSVKDIVREIQGWKDKGYVDTIPYHESQYREIAQIYEEYQKYLKSSNAMDFGDLLLYTLILFQQNEDILRHYRNKFRYIHVDEYQDTNTVQYLLLRLLYETHGNICCVGDEDQSIYGWRGAEIENILSFSKIFQGAQIVRLEKNYRSTQPILACALGIIQQNIQRLGKKLYSVSQDTADKVNVMCLEDDRAEVKWILDEIVQKKNQGYSLSHIAILFRVAAQSRIFEQDLVGREIAYQVLGGQAFYEKKEIRDIVAYLRLVGTPSYTPAFERVVNVPKRSLGTKFLEKLAKISRDQGGTSLFEAACLIVETDVLSLKQKTSLKNFLDLLTVWQSGRANHSLVQLCDRILEESGYYEMLDNDLENSDGPLRRENIQSFLYALKDFESLDEFLEFINLVHEEMPQEGIPKEHLQLMTIHAAKGKEFDVVFLPGLEEDLLPSERSVREGRLEEERRLVYVGITRAKKELYLTYAKQRFRYGHIHRSEPSRFLKDLPYDFVGEKKTKILGDPRFSQKYVVWSVGDYVKHKKFGAGIVLNIRFEAIQVIFETGEEKWVLSDFLTQAF